MEPQKKNTIDTPELAHRRVVAWRLYEQAAWLLVAAEQSVAGPQVSSYRPADLSRATAARLQVLAAGLEAPAVAPVPAPIGRPHPRRSA